MHAFTDTKVVGWRPGCHRCQWAGPRDGTKTHFRQKKNEGKESHRAHVGTGIAFPPSAGEVRASPRCRGHAPAGGEGAAELKEEEEEEDGDRGTGRLVRGRRMRMMQKLGLLLSSSLQQPLQWGEVGDGGEEGLASGFGAVGCRIPFSLGIFWVVVTGDKFSLSLEDKGG